MSETFVPFQVLTADEMNALVAAEGGGGGGGVAGVTSVVGDSGAVTLAQLVAGGVAPLNSPALTGSPTAPTPTLGDNDTSIATTAFVAGSVAAATAGVSQVVGFTGAVTLANLVTGGVASTTYLAPYAGAVSRPLASKLTDIVSVVDMGADPTGVADSTTAIQAAINTNQAVFFPTGTFKVNAVILLDNPGQLIFGAGPGSVVMTSSATNVVFSITANLIHICDLALNSSVTRTAGGGNNFIDIVNVGYIHIHDLLLQNFASGIRMGGALIACIRIHDLTMNFGHTGAGIEIDGGVDIVIADVIMSGTSPTAQLADGVFITACGDVTLRHVGTVYCGNGLGVGPPSGAVIQALFVDECLFDSGSGAGIDVEAVGLVQLLKISNTWSCTNTSGAIILNTHGSGAVQQTDIINCVMSNSTGGQGLMIASTSVTGTTVIGSTFGSNSGNGIYITPGCEFFKIIGNTIGISGEFPGNTGYGIALGAGCDDFIISNNLVLGNTAGSINYGAPAGIPGTTNVTYSNIPFTGGTGGGGGGGGGGTGTINAGAALELAFYTAAGTTLGGANAFHQVLGSTAIIGIGTNGSLGGQLTLAGLTSGATGLTVPAVAGSYTLTLPPNAGANGELLATDGAGNTSWNWASAVFGTVGGGNAGAGFVGEFISSNVAGGSAVAVTSNVPKNITSISLTAGDWDVEGSVCPTFSVGGVSCFGCTTTTSATLATQPNGGGMAGIAFPSGTVTFGTGSQFPTGKQRVSISSTTTVYLVIQTGFTSGTGAAFGFIGARRVR